MTQKIERVVLRIPPALKKRLIEKLNGRTMTYVGQRLLECWVKGQFNFGSDDDPRPVRRRA